MLFSTLRGLLAGSLSLALLTGGRAANPYQSRLDREYKSLSNAISRAYSPPPPAPTRSYTSSSYSSSSNYSASSNRRNSSPSSYSTSSSSRSSSYTSNYASSAAESRASRAALSRFQAEAQKRKSPFGSTRVAPGSASPAQTTARQFPSTAFVEWNLYRTRLEGRAPLVEPPDRALQSRRSEFEYFSTIARREGKKAPWENMRAGQLCLLAQGDEASPERAFAFFANSDPSWIEVQYGLGVCYLRGYGVTADPAKAREQLARAAKTPPKPRTRYVAGGELVADPGFEAARDLGIAYDLGLGQPANPRLALTWIEIADARPLAESDREQLKALRVEFWRRHHGEIRTIIEQDFAAVKAG